MFLGACNRKGAKPSNNSRAGVTMGVGVPASKTPSYRRQEKSYADVPKRAKEVSTAEKKRYGERTPRTGRAPRLRRRHLRNSENHHRVIRLRSAVDKEKRRESQTLISQ